MNLMSHEIVSAILESDEDSDRGLGKDLIGPSEETLNLQLSNLLPQAIKRKELHLKKPVVKTIQHTNPQGDTFIYGEFGRRSKTMATLLYLRPETGWELDDWLTAHQESVEDEGSDDFKDIIGEPVIHHYLPLGSVSHGTMRLEDLIPAFLEALRSVDPEKADKLDREAETLGDDEEERAYFCWETLADNLNEHAPPYTYFGSHPGDGADYGVWVSTESIDEELEYENVDELSAVKEGEKIIPGKSSYVVAVDAAGNYVEMYDGSSGNLIWSIW